MEIPQEPGRDEYAQRVGTLFSRIAGVYDPLNTFFSLGIDSLWRKRLAAAALSPASGAGKVLDLAAGTMEVSLALVRKHPRHTVLAMDFCRPMLAAGLPKLRKQPELGARIIPLTGDAKTLPLKNNSVQAVTLAFGLRNIRPRAVVLAEALRVLTSGGRLCVLEFAGAHTPILFGLYNLYLAHVLPFIGRLVSRDEGAYQHLADSVAAFPPAEELADEMRAAGFACVSHTAHTGGIVTLHVATKG